MKIEKLLVDSNILLRLSDLSSPQHPVCRRAIDECIRKGVPLAVCTQVLIEFWSVSTRPLDANGLNRTVEDTYQSCLDTLDIAVFLPDPEDILDRWLDLVRRYEVRGKQVHDARLVALASAYGIPQILTLNPQDFARYAEVTALLPEDVLR